MKMGLRKDVGKQGTEPEMRKPGKLKLCAWTASGKYGRCQMLGGISEGGPSYCSWHYFALRAPQHAEDFEEFCRWRELNRETYPVNYDRAYLYIDDHLAFSTVLGETSHADWRRTCKIYADEWQAAELAKLPKMENGRSSEYYIKQVYEAMKWNRRDK